MAQRDYKNSAPRRGSQKKRGGLLVSLLIVVLVSLVLAAVALWFLWPRPQDFRKISSAPVLTPAPAAIDTPAKTEDKTAAPPQADTQNYTFYDILPGNQAPKPLPAKQDTAQWWLQVAALKSTDDADSLRAKLALLNFTAIVEPTTKDSTTLYRVRIGPFPTQAEAELVQKKLAENKFEARPLKEAVVH